MSPVTLAHLRSIGWTLFECVDCSAQRLGPEGMDRCGDCQPANRMRNYSKIEKRRQTCRKGHAMTPENTLRRRNHRGVECRECHREGVRRAKAKRVMRQQIERASSTSMEMREGA
jgi:hypothetical protein